MGERGRREVVAEKRQNDDLWGLYSRLRMLFPHITGIQGLQLALSERPNCIVMDVKMPQLNGHHVARLLRGDPETEAIPLVALSALKQEWDVVAGQASGADEYVVKPVSIADLVRTIQRVIARSQNERAQRMEELARKNLLWNGIAHWKWDVHPPSNQMTFPGEGNGPIKRGQP